VKTAAKYVLEDVVPWARVRFGVSGIGVTGVGAGGQGALRLAFDRPDLFRVVTSLSGAIDHYEVYGQGTSLDEMYPSKEHCRQDGAILHVQPHDWPPYLWFSCDPNSYWFRGNDRLHEKLTALGVPHGFDQSQVCGHSWSYYDTLAGPLIGFTVDGLQKESRRLV
jgi:S-formylglutathione hydrolase